MHAVLPEDAEPSVEVDPFENASDFTPVQLPPLTLPPAEESLVVLAQQGLRRVQFGEPVVESAENGRLQLVEGVAVLFCGQEVRRVGLVCVFTSKIANAK